MKDLQFTLAFDKRGRPILQPGDIVGVVAKGPLGWLNRNFITPHTNLFHFFLIIQEIIGGNDFIILESINKGVAIGRLNWYKNREYVVFRVNDADAWYLGERASQISSKFGRHWYDFGLFFKLAAWALGYCLKEIATGHIPRPVTPGQIPYDRDNVFICTEMVFEAWRLVGIYLRAKGHAPVPAEFILARDRGDIAVIDSHNGDPANWRAEKSPLYKALAEAKGNDTIIVNGDNVSIKKGPGGDIVGRQGGQERNRTHIYRQPFGYPIRLCDWVAVDVETIERIGEAQGLTGPAEAAALVMALDWAETNKDAVICKHCRAVVQGKRGPLMGGPGGAE